MAHTPDASLLRKLPKIDEVLSHPDLQALAQDVPHSVLTDAARAAVACMREKVLAGGTPDVSLAAAALTAAAGIQAVKSRSLRRVINANGVVIHTNLGRSPLAQEAVDAVVDVARGYSTLEYDTSAMARGSRHAHCESLICALCGAEAAIAVNNNAAAVMMVLSTFASGHEAIVSRGELIEIGGSFRIPDIMAQSGAAMVEVGTTNKTHPTDYERAITSDTKMLLKVHPSNYRMLGFTEGVNIGDLRTIADTANATREAGEKLLLFEDLGSGSFAALPSFKECDEHTVADSLAAGADLVSFSGDKLLGGPQAGIIVGSKELIARLKASPLARVLRLDKMTLAALEATLRLYLHPETAIAKIPTLRMLSEDADAVLPRAQALLDALEAKTAPEAAEFELVEEISRSGGGALPMVDIPTWCVRVTFKRGDAQGCSRFLEQDLPVPIICRIKDEALLADARTLLSEEEILLTANGIASYFETLGE